MAYKYLPLFAAVRAAISYSHINGKPGNQSSGPLIRVLHQRRPESVSLPDRAA